MEKALRLYNGKPLINSVNGKQEIMDTVFPLVKKYGGLVVALTLDEDVIPEDSARRVEIAKKIYDRHKTLTKGLVYLGVDPGVAEDDACRIEHCISDESFYAIKNHVMRFSADEKAD